ncbi:MAG: hypothetical protein NVS9B10_27390 [Nevskia sp.]
MSLPPPSTAARLRAARKILVLDFGGLGDHIHSLPALWLLRQHCPDAALHVLGGAELFGTMTPWIDRVWDYRKGGLKSDLGWIACLRRERYEAAIVVTSSNHAVALGGLSGAALRCARKADENKRWLWQPWLLDAVLDVPFHTEPMYRQRWTAFRQLGLAGSAAPEFHVTIDAGLRRAAGIEAGDDRTYLHFSASATDDRRDLPLAQMIALWNALHARFPERRIAVSGHGTPRGRAKLAAILEGIAFTPWRVFDGTLDVAAFVSVMQGAALHVGPDSGGLHVARLAGTPSVSWFRPNHHIRNWFPDTPEHLAFVAPESREDGLYGFDLATFVRAAEALLAPLSAPR